MKLQTNNNTQQCITTQKSPAALLSKLPARKNSFFLHYNSKTSRTYEKIIEFLSKFYKDFLQSLH